MFSVLYWYLLVLLVPSYRGVVFSQRCLLVFSVSHWNLLVFLRLHNWEVFSYRLGTLDLMLREVLLGLRMGGILIFNRGCSLVFSFINWNLLVFLWFLNWCWFR